MLTDASLFHETWSKRSPGTSTLRLIEGALIAPLPHFRKLSRTGANHNYIKRYDDLVDAIMAWLDVVDPKAKL